MVEKALLFSGAWIALTIGAGLIHTNIVLAGKITPQQDEAISEKYGRLCGTGLVLIWVIFGWLHKRGKSSDHES
jgi:hypothetical protein